MVVLHFEDWKSRRAGGGTFPLSAMERGLQAMQNAIIFCYAALERGGVGGCRTRLTVTFNCHILYGSVCFDQNYIGECTTVTGPGLTVSSQNRVGSF